MRSLRIKILVILSGIILAIYSSLTFAGSHEIRGIISGSNEQAMNSLVQQTALDLNIRMVDVERAVQALASYILSNIDLKKVEEDEKYLSNFEDELYVRAEAIASVPRSVETAYFRLDPKKYGPTSGIFFRRGMHEPFIRLVPTDILKYASTDREHVGWFYEAKDRGVPIWLPPYSNQNINVLMVSYIIPLYKNDDFFGVIGMDVNMAELHRSIDKIDYKNGFGFLMDKNGSLVYHKDYPEGLSVIQLDSGLREAATFLLEKRSPENKITRYEWQGRSHFLVGSDLQNGMILAFSVPAEEVYKPGYRMRRLMIIILFAVIFMLCVMLQLVIQHVVRPIDELTKAASRISKGELNVPIHHHSDDEIGRLADSIRKMAAELKEYISYIHSQAYTDSMTAVGNKSAYMDMVKVLDRKIIEGLADFAVIVFDVNGLKRVNDNFGHEIGDALISDAANVLKTVFGADSIYRIGGDEFIVIKEKILESEAEKLFEKFHQTLKEFNKSPRKYESELSISSGLTFCREDDESYKTVFHRADDEMYKEKRAFYQGRNDRRSR